MGIYEEHPFESYFSGNTVQICPVGALTGSAYRFRSRPFDLVSTPSACEHCASGCSLRTDHRRGTVLRRMAQNDPAVNEEWNCDKGRWAFQSANVGDRLQFPMVRKGGELVVASWPEALDAAAAGLKAAKAPAVLTGGRVTAEDAYAYGKFARAILGTNDVDFRARPHSAEEAAFLASHVVATGPDGGAVTYADLEKAKAVVLVGFEPEDESPIVFLRLRKAVTKGATKVYAVAPWSSPGLSKLNATVYAAGPGREIEALTNSPEVLEALRLPGAVLMVGERAACSPGLLSWAADTAGPNGSATSTAPCMTSRAAVVARSSSRRASTAGPSPATSRRARSTASSPRPSARSTPTPRRTGCGSTRPTGCCGWSARWARPSSTARPRSTRAPRGSSASPRFTCSTRRTSGSRPPPSTSAAARAR